MHKLHPWATLLVHSLATLFWSDNYCLHFKVRIWLHKLTSDDCSGQSFVGISSQLLGTKWVFDACKVSNRTRCIMNCSTQMICSIFVETEVVNGIVKDPLFHLAKKRTRPLLGIHIFSSPNIKNGGCILLHIQFSNEWIVWAQLIFPV